MKDKLGQEPAFPPSKITQELCPTCEGYHVGMTKRFYAACAAMQGILSSYAGMDMSDKAFPKFWIATESYKMADELLKQEGE